jgi:hypothetical protein
MRLEQVADKPPAPDANTWQTLWVALVLGAFMLGGGWWQRRYSFQGRIPERSASSNRLGQECIGCSLVDRPVAKEAL